VCQPVCPTPADGLLSIPLLKMEAAGENVNLNPSLSVSSQSSGGTAAHKAAWQSWKNL